MNILHAKGQTCNRLFTYSNFISDSLESNEKIIIFSPDISLRDYPNFYNLNFIKFPLYFKSIENIIGYKTYVKLLHFLWGNKYILKLLATILKPFPLIKVIVASTGSYKSKNIEKHKNELKNIFTPNNRITSYVTSSFESIRKNFKIICGVHIRRGDYRQWNGGRYFYTDEQFYSVMEKVKKLFPGQSLTFFISSNENINVKKFDDFDHFFIQNSEAMMDLYGLSLCDYIIGPPSTFSGWASFYGGKPVYFIENPHEEMSLTSFKPISEIWK